MPNPYSGLPDYNFWSRAVAWPLASNIDPVVESEFKIAKTDKIATIGSCFAQNLSRYLASSGFNYFVPESAPQTMSKEEGISKNYGVFSARYGNVYTVRQAVQLAQRAFGEFHSNDGIWRRKNRFVDAFRPQIEPDGFDSESGLLESRETHLAAVRRVFYEADIIVFTLGLTEGWRSRIDGAVYPLAPGVAGGEFDPQEHSFVNFDVSSVIDDLKLFCEIIQSVNRKARIILTISPVPLIATFEKRHVLVSTISSKSILRVAAEEVEKSLKRVHYFPSYEIITTPGLSDRYYDNDLRQILPIGVSHVMRVFQRHYLESETHLPKGNPDPNFGRSKNSGVICDEETIEEALALAFRPGKPQP